MLKKGMAVLISIAMTIQIGNHFEWCVNNVKAADYGVNNPRIAEDGTVTWDKIQFGNYKQSVEFEKQPIKWRILSVNDDGTDAFVMADRALDCKPYNDTCSSVTWENCTLRNWLNNEFYNEAFSTEEQTAIKEVTVTNEDNYNAEGGNPTTDKVYLLSIDEASNNEYGFDSKFTNRSETRYVKATDYAAMNGAFLSKISGYVGNCDCWWLRSLGTNSAFASYVNYDGAGYNSGRDVSHEHVGVCPALNINLSSVCVEDAGEVDSDGKVTISDNIYNNPRVSDGVTTWDCIYFGEYKQDNINNKKEPVEWKVLSINGDDAFIMADKALDCKPYNETWDDVTWETCTLRNWLNNEFYNEAFSADEQAAVKEVTVANEDNPSYNTEGGNSTKDKVYLLSIDEASNKEYGFDSEFTNRSGTRYVNATDYTAMNGAYRGKSSEDGGNGIWWLRSPGNNSLSASYVYCDGAGYGNCGVFSANVGVCPVLHINLSSDTWSSAGTVRAKLSNYNSSEPEPSNVPTATPTDEPAATPTTTPSNKPENTPNVSPTDKPENTPTATPTAKPSNSPTSEPTAEDTAIPTSTPVSDTTAEPSATSTPISTTTPTIASTDTPTIAPTATLVPTTSQAVGSVTQSPTPSASISATPQPDKTVTEKLIKLTSVKTKAKSKKITGKISIKGATVKIKVGKKAYKKAKVKGKTFTIKLNYRLKKNTKIIINVSKSNYTDLKKTYKVK